MTQIELGIKLHTLSPKYTFVLSYDRMQETLQTRRI